MRDAGTYALLIPLEAGLRLRIGRLGIHHLVPGWYVYAGSALGGLSGRLRHHLGPKGRLHWHIDYLLAEARVGRVWYAVSATRLECAWNQVIGGLPGAGCPVPGFGASDCHCRSHLTYFPSMPPMALFAEKLGRMGMTLYRQVEGQGIVVRSARSVLDAEIADHEVLGGFHGQHERRRHPIRSSRPQAPAKQLLDA